MLGIPRITKLKSRTRGEDKKSTRYTFNIIVGGFTRGRETSFSRKRYAHQILNEENIPYVKIEGKLQALEAISHSQRNMSLTSTLTMMVPWSLLSNMKIERLKDFSSTKGALQTYCIGSV